VASDGWRNPELRACFLFDDPNLHWPSYGHLHYEELARDAAHHRYHVAIATVPLDGWLVHPQARNTFARHPEALSLIIHGNEHVRHELGRRRNPEDALALAHQALARIAALERRAGLAIARIMAPPHGVCSEEMAGGLLRAGFEALTVSRPYPWLERPPSGLPLAGWRPAEFVARGLPVLERRPLGTSVAELALLAYLDHPLILYGHHGDVAGGTARLRALRDRLSVLGPIRWKSIEALARSNFSTRRDGETLYVRLHGRCAELHVPADVLELVVELPGHPSADEEFVYCGTERTSAGQPIPVQSGSQYRVRLGHASELEPPNPSRRRQRVWPLIRRGMSEARDRSLPIIDRVAARGSTVRTPDN
jgi:hypothetical protein